MTLTDSEVEYIKGILKRDMNSLEEGMLDVMFSEHCSYKSSRPILRLFPTEGENIILGPGDDAGLVSVTDKYALAVGMESHNHPSAIEPYGGAGTGIGGILRDIISMGAMPIALLDSLRFGPLEDEKSRYLFEHVVKGISDYGNRVGVPTVAGEVEFDESFRTNPLVNVMCVGLVEKDKIVRGIAPNVGDVFLLMGGTTGRDGIHGVTFASEELTSDSETEDRPAVQVADPFTKKRVLEASLEILEKINVSGVKDLGGGGLTCCISELADSSDNGASVDLRSIPLREEGMTPYEIMLSESQERMVFVINPDDVELAKSICDKHEIVSAVIGEVTDGDNMVIIDEGEESLEFIKKYRDKFILELSDDLNTANALSVLYELLKDEHLSGSSKLSLIRDFDQFLSLDLIQEKKVASNEDYILEQIEKRAEAKRNKDFALADAIREELLSQGIRLIDSRDGTTYEIID